MTKYAILLVVPLAATLLAQDTSPNHDKAIRDKLAAPPLFLDEQHQGPTFVPKDLPPRIHPFDCRATQAFLHRVRPGEYHFRRAQRLLGQGIDVIHCEAFGLDRFSDDNDKRPAADQAVQEAEAAAALPIGLESWRPGALGHILTSAYQNAAIVHRDYGNKHGSERDKAIAQGFEEKLRKVRELKDDISSPAVVGRTPLMNALLSNNQAGVVTLLKAGVDVNAMDSDHTSALRIAVVMGNVDAVRLLLAHGAEPDVRDEDGSTAFMDACAMGRMDIAGALLRAGSDPNAKANDGSTALLNAISWIALHPMWQARREFVRFLLENKADVNAADWKGITPLIAAARRADMELIRALLIAGADVEGVNAEGRTPLLEAIDKDNVDSVKLLVSKGAKLTVLDKRGYSALNMAARKGYPEGEQMVKLLLEAGADPNLANSDGWTPLLSAETFEYREPWGVSSHAITKELLKRGADPNARTRNGTTALIAAAGHRGPDDASFLLELLEAGAHVNATDKDGQTALMAAAEMGHVSKVTLLIERGANFRAKDKTGKTALDYARPPRGDNDYEFPNCYESLKGEDPKPMNDCEGTRRLLRSHIDKAERKRTTERSRS